MAYPSFGLLRSRRPPSRRVRSRGLPRLSSHTDTGALTLFPQPDIGTTRLLSLHAAYAALIRRGPERARDKVAMRLLANTPSVRARNLEKHLVWSELMTPIVAKRLEGADAHLRARVLVHASLSAFQLALMAWADDPEERPITQLLELTFRDLREQA
ncbi:hypothetical protein ABZU94_40365 [Streptomyces mirabilis]|uniref:acyl-CoA-like ligand-binding transcription factor n=1 Tax=Streptomyces sp. NPDC005388 TaxID=3156717 RepID=UPI0033B2A8B2